LTKVSDTPNFGHGPLDTACQPLPMPSNEAHLWCWFDYESDRSPERLKAFEALLDDEERQRLFGFAHEEARHRYLATRVLVRTTLSRYSTVSPSDWRFEQTAAGRPFVRVPELAPALQFNVTNTSGLVACLVSGGSAEIGVDAEDFRREVDYQAIADRFFSGREARALRALAPPQRAQRFYQCWTLREAYLKARGIGLAAPLEELEFQCAAGEGVRARFGPGVADDSSRWQFDLFQAGTQHILAVALGNTTLILRLKGDSSKIRRAL
jgi:4'-phosphopantetheinyl transferase